MISASGVHFEDIHLIDAQLINELGGSTNRKAIVNFSGDLCNAVQVSSIRGNETAHSRMLAESMAYVLTRLPSPLA